MWILQNGCDNLTGVVLRRLKLRIGVVGCERQAHRRTSVEATLDGCTHSTRVEHIDSRVGAVVDARDNQINRPLLKEVVKRPLHAINRRARQGVNLHTLLLATLLKKERIVHSDCLTATTLWLGWGYRYHASKFACHLNGCRKALCLIAIVVCYKYQSFLVHFSTLDSFPLVFSKDNNYLCKRNKT